MNVERTRWEDALKAWETAQHAVDLARKDGTPWLAKARAYRVRALANELLSQTAPMSTHISVIHAYLAAARLDALTAEDCALLAREAGEAVTK